VRALMKSSAGYVQPRRLTAQKKLVQLSLRRTASRTDDEFGTQPKSHFWKWVGLVALLHVLVISTVGWFYWASPAPTPPESFISLLPEGDVTKGTPGTQEAAKVGASTPAIHHTAPPPAAAFQPPAPPVIKQVQPKPVIEEPDAPTVVQEKTVTPPKPVTPKPKVKVDLNLADGPVPLTNKPLKPTPSHLKKTVTTTETANATDRPAVASPDDTGLSREEIAKKLGQKLQAAGVANATHIGPSGSEHAQANPFADFYLSVRDQVMSKWERPNLDDESAINPEVRIHVENDGRVPPESVTLVRSSGNPAYDDSALAAARSLGQLLQPLPDGCPPDISITFKLTR
jgi:TonB family protein